MNGKKRLATTNLCLSVAALLCIAMPVAVHAARDELPSASAAATAQQPAQEILELDEIWVHGKKLAARIADAEDDFVRQYNKVNKNGDYEVTCGYVALERGSMIMTRTCAPAFIGYNEGLASSNGYVGYSGSTFGTACSSMNASTRVLDSNGDSSYIASTCAYYTQVYSPPSALAPVSVDVSPEVRKGYADNFLVVLKSDRQLLAQAMGLAVLYREMDSVQGRYIKAREVDKQARRDLAPRKSGSGPRTN